MSPLKNKGKKDVDFVIFRENTEGFYGGIGGHFKRGTLNEVAIAEEIHTRMGVERIIRAPFSWADENKKSRGTLADKSNAIGAHQLWRDVFIQVSKEYPGLSAEHLYIDTLAMQWVLHPERFEVIVTTNLFGDILSDLGAALAGGLGLAASANLNPQSVPLFEPVHGSAPDIAGTGQANPIAMILTPAMMLDYLGHPNASQVIKKAVTRVLELGGDTVDVRGSRITTQTIEKIISALD